MIQRALGLIAENGPASVTPDQETMMRFAANAIRGG
jgi:hypothetical protein